MKIELKTIDDLRLAAALFGFETNETTPTLERIAEALERLGQFVPGLPVDDKKNQFGS